MLKSFFLRCHINIPHLRPTYSFGSRDEKIIQNVDKDLTKVQTIQESIKEDHKKFISDYDVQKFRPLSQAPLDKNLKKFGLKFAEDKKKLNKVLRENYKKAITTKPGEMAEKFLDEHEIANLPENRRENLRKIEEMKHFNKVFFRKNEVIRLLRKQELMVEHFLPINALNNDSFLLDLRQKYHDYKENMNILKNNRIDNVFFHSNENQKLALLLQSGLLDNEKNINEVIMKSVELMQAKKKESETAGFLEDNTKEITVLGKNLPEDFETDKELYISMIKSMGFQLDENLTQYDFEKLALFFEAIIKIQPKEKQRILENLHLIQKIKAFEEFLFDQFVNNALDIRVKGRAEFKDLTEKESLNYVKYNLQNVEEMFLMFDNSKEIRSPALISSMLQKISLFKLKKHYSIVHVINDKRYAAILRCITDSVHALNNREFVNTVWAIAKIHKDEKGLINKRIFIVLAPRITKQVVSRMKKFTIEELSFLCRGLINFPMLDLKKEPEFSKELFSCIEEKMGKTNNLFAFMGFNLFISVNQSEKSLELLQKSLDILSENQVMIDEFDENDITDVCYFYSAFLNLKPRNELFIGKIKGFLEKINGKILEYVEKFTLDEISSLLIVFADLNLIQKDLILNLRKKMLDSLKDYERFRDFSLSKMAVSLGYFDYVQKKPQFKFHINYFFESMLMISLFPNQLHKPTSPKYIPFFEIAKILETNKGKINEKWLVSTLFTLASVNFRNEQLFESIILYLIEEKNTKNLESLSYLTIISTIVQITGSTRNLLKESFFNCFKQNLKEDKEIDPALCARLVYIFNVIYQDYNDFNECLMIIKANFRYFSIEFLVLLAWSFTFAKPHQNNEDFLKELGEFFLNDKLNLNELKKNAYSWYLYNQTFHLTNIQLLDPFSSNENLKSFYKNLDETIEEIEFHHGKRFTTKAIKSEIQEFLVEENLIVEIEFFTKTGIKVDFLLKDRKNAINVNSDEHYCMNLEGNKVLKSIFQNENEIVGKKEGLNVVNISSNDYLNIGTEYKKIDDEKKAKKLFLKKIIRNII